VISEIGELRHLNFKKPRSNYSQPIHSFAESSTLTPGPVAAEQIADSLYGEGRRNTIVPVFEQPFTPYQPSEEHRLERLRSTRNFNRHGDNPRIVPKTFYVVLLSFAAYQHDALKNADILFKEELQLFFSDKMLFTTRKSRKKQLEGHYPFNPVTRNHKFSKTDFREVVAVSPAYEVEQFLSKWEKSFNDIVNLKRIGLQTLWLSASEFNSSDTCGWTLCRTKYKQWRRDNFKIIEN